MVPHHVQGSASNDNNMGVDSDVLEFVVSSLYWDQIKPTEPDVIRRLGELFPGSLSEEPSVMQLFISHADRGVVSVSNDPPGRRVVELLCAPTWFYGWIDPNDTDYNFPIEVWEGVCHYSICVLLSQSATSEAAGGRPYQFKGGRYGFGKHLQGAVLRLYEIDGCGIACGDCERFIRSIQFFSLGRICQLIQFAISTGVLRYEENLLQPIVSCKLPSSALASRLLPQLIEPPVAGSQDICQEITSFSELKKFLELLFERETGDQIPLSQLKKKMIGSFQRVLNPARLGHVKLSQVLEKLDYPFSVVSIGNNSYLCLSDNHNKYHRRSEPLTPSTVTSSSSSARDA